MKHRLQWKFVGIMLLSLFGGLCAMATAEGIYFGKILRISPEEAEERFPNYSPVFNVIFILVSILLFFIFSRKTIKRIEEMNQKVESIAAGNLSGLVEDHSRDELGNLSRNINTMAVTIQESLEKEKSMICNIAHDLRTPITSINGYVELLQKNEHLPGQEREYVEIIYRKSKELAEQVNDLLEYSILQFKQKEYPMEELSLSSLLEQIIIDFIPALEKENMTFQFTGNQKPFVYRCNQSLMIRLFSNLMTNCIRYGKKGKKIDIEIKEANENIQICFTNYGESLSKEDTDKLFQTFYQGENAKPYQTEGKGLGLAICQSIVQLHQGTIEAVADPENLEVSFVIKL